MKKSLFLIIILVSILFTSCTVDKSEKVIKKIKEQYNENAGYETNLEMTIFMDNKETIYKMKERFSPDNISLEVLEPSQSKGITIEYKDDKVILHHASIKQSISLKMVKNFDKGILLSNFLKRLEDIESISEKEMDNKDYYQIKYSLEESNRYNFRSRIYLNKKTLEPYIMEIMDEDDNIRMKIKYDKFKYLKDI